MSSRVISLFDAIKDHKWDVALYGRDIHLYVWNCTTQEKYRIKKEMGKCMFFSDDRDPYLTVFKKFKPSNDYRNQVFLGLSDMRRLYC